MTRRCGGRARSQARIARKKLEGSEEKEREREEGKKHAAAREGTRERKRERDDFQGESRLSSKSVHPNRARVSAGPNWRGSRGLSLRFKTPNGRALLQQMVVVIAAAFEDEHLPSCFVRLSEYRWPPLLVATHSLRHRLSRFSRFISVGEISALSPFPGGGKEQQKTNGNNRRDRKNQHAVDFYQRAYVNPRREKRS